MFETADIEHLKAAAQATYDAHIERAIYAAIALMRAARPRDEKAEREHCEAGAIELANVHASKRPGAGAANHFQSWAQDKLLRERAAARAESAAELATLRAENVLLWNDVERLMLRRQGG
jgi:hypothetical protein